DRPGNAPSSAAAPSPYPAPEISADPISIPLCGAMYPPNNAIRIQNKDISSPIRPDHESAIKNRS
ncbi:hypothetical protein ACTXQV_68040, partial [Klebsiella pneumoniae]